MSDGEKRIYRIRKTKAKKWKEEEERRQPDRWVDDPRASELLDPYIPPDYQRPIKKPTQCSITVNTADTQRLKRIAINTSLADAQRNKAKPKKISNADMIRRMMDHFEATSGMEDSDVQTMMAEAQRKLSPNFPIGTLEAGAALYRMLVLILHTDMPLALARCLPTDVLRTELVERDPSIRRQRARNTPDAKLRREALGIDDEEDERAAWEKAERRRRKLFGQPQPRDKNRTRKKRVAQRGKKR